MKTNESAFLNFLESGIDIDLELIVGGAEMPASFVWDEACRLTEYGKELFHDLLASQYQVLPNGNIEIFCDNYRLGEAFCLAAAGYISQEEYDKIFCSTENIPV